MFKFELKAKTKIEQSGETGEIIGRSEYTTAESCYYLRYVRADGVATEDWWRESALVPG